MAFRPPRPKGRGHAGKITQKKGLKIGLATDKMFIRVVAKKQLIDPSNPKHKRCHNLFLGLRKRGVKAVRTQFRVSMPELGIRTDIDALGVRGNTVVVIELKTTQWTLEQHREMYDRTCLNKRKLSNGLLNTERNAHALQTGFGMLGLRRHLPKSTKIEGLVVVCAADGAQMYDVDPFYSDEKHFVVPAIKPAVGSYVKSVNFQPMPSTDAAIRCLQKALKEKGFPFTMRNVLTSFGTKYGSFTLSVGTNSYLVVALVCTREKKAGEKKMRQLEDDAHKLWIDKKKKCRVRACMVRFFKGVNPIRGIDFITKSHHPVATK